MKRKKQARELSNGLGDEPTPKRARSGTRAISFTEEDDGHDQSSDIPARRRSFRRGELGGASADGTRDHGQSSLDQEGGDRASRIAEEPTGSESEDVNDEDTLIFTATRNSHISSSIVELQGNGTTPVKKLKGKMLFSTPVKLGGATETNDTPELERHADRSARRKSTRNLIERTVLGNTSDNDDEDEDIAQHIYSSDEGDEPEKGNEVDEKAPESAPATPARRGRPKGSKNRQRSPSPIRDLPPHEVYFSQNRGGHSKTSNNNLSSLALLDHEEYFTLVRNYEDPHTADIDSLQKLYASSFNQWRFELSQDFNICLYGWGSKRSLLLEFAEYIFKTQPDHANNQVVVVNGYVHSLTIRDVLNTIAGAISETGLRLGSQPAEMLEKLIAALEGDENRNITVVIHSIDGPALRRPTTQTIISRLSSHPQIQLICSADHPSFPLLWDSSLRSMFNFLFHNCTTFQPYSSEVDVVEDVHELLGRSGRRVGGKEGVSFVLKSLPENAKNLFRVLIGEQLAAMDESLGAGFGDIDDDDDDYDNERHANNPGRNEPGVEYKVLYQKACEEFICSSEMSFRTLLKEYVGSMH
jgi:origin recognition complex subunit 2